MRDIVILLYKCYNYQKLNLMIKEKSKDDR